MEMNLIKTGIRALRENAQVAYVASVNGEGFPQIKGMLSSFFGGMDLKCIIRKA